MHWELQRTFNLLLFKFCKFNLRNLQTDLQAEFSYISNNVPFAYYDRL